MKENKIEIQNVNKFYGRKQVLFNLNLTIGQGMFGLLGRNGAGKTTLMKLLAALHEKQSGSVTVCGIPIEHANEIRSITGYLPQDFSMYPSMTAKECLNYLGALSGMSAAALRERVPLLLARVNLTEQQNKRIKALSGGMKRRLGIAQALLHNPRVLIVDEPTAGLDPEERIRFRNLLSEVAKERIVLLSTHIVGDIEAACEQLAILNEGRLIYQGSVSRLLENALGKVYSIVCSPNEAAQLKSKYQINGINSQGESFVLRFIAETPPDLPDARPVPPNVEDAYLLCLYENGCSMRGGGL